MQKTIIYLFAIGFYCIISHINAQSYQNIGKEKIDALKYALSITEKDTAKIRMLNNLSQGFIDAGLFDEGDSVAREALKLADKINFRTLKGDSYNKIGLVYLNKGQFTTAREYFFKALTAERLIFNQPGYIKRLGNIGITYSAERNYELSAQYYQIALSMAKLYGNKALLAYCYNNLGDLFMQKEDNLKAFNYISKALEVNKNQEDKNFFIVSLRRMSNIYERWGDCDKAHQYIFRALQVSESVGNKIKIQACLAAIAHIYKRKGDNSRAFEYFFRALKLAEELKNDSQITNLCSAIGGSYFEAGDMTHAAEYFTRAYELAKKSNNQNEIASQTGNLGLIYNEKGEKDKALIYYLKSLEISKKLNLKNNTQAWLGNVALLYLEKADTFQNKDSIQFYRQKALSCLQKALKNAEDRNLKIDKVNVYYLLGFFYQEKDEVRKALEYYKKSLEMSFITGEVQCRKKIFEKLSMLYGKQKNFQLQLQYYERYIDLRDSLYNKESLQKKLKSELNFEFEKKQSLERSRQERLNSLALAEKKRQKTILWFMISFALLIFLAATFIYRSYLQKRKANNELQIKNQHIEIAHKIIAEKNHEITDSINYALHIQQAILPHKEDIFNILPNSCIVYQPKDIVSGDFYFFEEKQGKLFIAAADCTGHGVPGGFMSMIGSEKLKNAIKESSDPGKILSLLNEGIKSSLHQSEHAYTNRNGMDIALCVINIKEHQVEFAGANRPIWILRRKSEILEEITGTKASIGGITENDKCFLTHKIQLEEGDSFYIFSDGYADQFGVNNKKITTKRFKNFILENRLETIQMQGKLFEEFLNRWKGDTEQTDDILVIGVRL